MTDLGLAAAWSALLLAALGGAVLVRRLGVPTTYVRDLLHVGAGVWVVGWPWWGAALPAASIVAVVAAGTVAVPVVAGRLRAAAHLRDAVSDDDERWGGLILYTASYAVLTVVGLVDRALPAAGALLALSLGDGVGGLIGRRFGHFHYRAPGGKRKSLEGSLAVAVFATAGVVVAGALVGEPVGLAAALAAGVVAAVAEAAAPRGTDNAIVPAAVWLLLRAVG